MKSWKTTVCGIGMILSVVAAVVVALLDGDAETNPEWSSLQETLVNGLGLAGISFGGLLGVAARDNSKSNAS